MQEEDPKLKVVQQGGVTIAEPTDRKLLDEINITQIGAKLTGLVTQQTNPKLIIDFVNVTHMSSSALGMLITLHKRIAERHGQLKLCNIAPSIHEIFVITRLNEILQICDSRQEALDESFS